MKYITYLTFALITLVSCTQKPNDFVVFTGTINDAPEVDSIVLVNDVLNYRKTIPVNSDGSFRDTITIDTARVFGLMVETRGQNIYLQNNHDLHINWEKDSLAGKLAFSGTLSNINNYYKSKLAYFHNLIFGDNRDYRRSSLLSEKDFTELAAKLNKERLAILQHAEIEDEDFVALETQNLFWEDIAFYVRYVESKIRITKRDSSKTYVPSPGFLPEAMVNFEQYANNLDLYVNSENYRLVSVKIARKELHATDMSNYSVDEKLKFIKNQISKIGLPLLKDQVLKGFCFGFLRDQNPETIKPFIDYFVSASTDEGLKNRFEDYYSNSQNTLKGAISPKFTDYENHAGGTTSLDDFKGKYVYIDVWATWCGPCREEFPFLKEVEKKYHGKNIEFVSISTDKKPSYYDAWRAMVADRELPGAQLIADNGPYSQFINAYNINSIPRFILIDPEGKIVDANAPRPSNPELIKLFDTLDI